MAGEKQESEFPTGRCTQQRGPSGRRFIAAHALLVLLCFTAVYTISRLSDVREEGTPTDTIFTAGDPELVWDVVRGHSPLRWLI